MKLFATLTQIKYRKRNAQQLPSKQNFQAHTEIRELFLATSLKNAETPNMQRVTSTFDYMV